MPADSTMSVPASTSRTVADLDLHPAVLRFVDAVRAQFGDRLDRIVLYGSRARGDHRPDSDYDFAIFVRDLVNAYTEFMPLAEIVTWALVDDDVEINARLHPADTWHSGESSFLREVRRDGVAL